MVVQQNSELTVRGHATPGSTVKAAPGWSSKVYAAKADADGTFTLKIATPAAGGPYSVTFSDPDGNVTLEIYFPAKYGFAPVSRTWRCPLSAGAK